MNTDKGKEEALGIKSVAFSCHFYLCLSVFICVHLWIQTLRRAPEAPWGGLATWTKVAAPACHDQPFDFCFATKARFPVALVNPVLKLEFAAIAVGIDVV
jgi:hypothetical protein